MTMKLQLLLFVTVLFLNAQFSSCKIWEIPVPDQLRECYKRVRDTPVDTFVGNLYSWLCEHTLMNYSNPNESFKITSDVTVYLEKLKTQETKSGTPREKRQTSVTFSPCVRKEYRMLTLDERRRYHNAVNALRRNTQTVFKPNLYTYFANLHGRDVSAIAHGGAGFLGWHRVYIRLYEALLKTVDPSVCLPYWDSTLDRRLTDPFLSSIWSPDFLGTPRGAVVDGPFANWRLANGGQLIRNVGTDADLLSTDTVNTILSRNSYDEIVSAGMLYNIEYHHGIIHNYVAGAMATPDTAANDPVFFMHHAFIDYIFERFRQKLRSRGVNPAIYPREISTPLHAPNSPMRLGKYTQADGYSENTARGITYEPVPTCSSRNTTCGRRFLVCQTSTGMCLPTVRSTATPSNRTRRSVDICHLPPPPTYDLPCQNDFCTRDKCDTSLWAMIPVKIISVRPPRYGKYNCFPVKDGEVNYKDDIYSPKAYKDTSKDFLDQMFFILTKSCVTMTATLSLNLNNSLYDVEHKYGTSSIYDVEHKYGTSSLYDVEHKYSTSSLYDDEHKYGTSSLYDVENKYGTSSLYDVEHKYGTSSLYDVEHKYGTSSIYDVEHKYGTSSLYDVEHKYGTSSIYDAENKYGTSSLYDVEHKYDTSSLYDVEHKYGASSL
ncbi:putative tyrosinase-like protein tyr-3 [Bulinus truncatus]|nr:putative tyrosinase-like protein tyr-3 [Bulinus truncatus]